MQQEIGPGIVRAEAFVHKIGWSGAQRLSEIRNALSKDYRSLFARESMIVAFGIGACASAIVIVLVVALVSAAA